MKKDTESKVKLRLRKEASSLTRNNRAKRKRKFKNFRNNIGPNVVSNTKNVHLIWIVIQCNVIINNKFNFFKIIFRRILLCYRVKTNIWSQHGICKPIC